MGAGVRVICVVGRTTPTTWYKGVERFRSSNESESGRIGIGGNRYTAVCGTLVESGFRNHPRKVLRDRMKANELESVDRALRCPNCDYNLTGLSQHRCPECGKPFDLTELRRQAARQRLHDKSGWAVRFVNAARLHSSSIVILLFVFVALSALILATFLN